MNGIDPTETGAQDRTKEQDITTLYESPHFERTPVAAQIENAGQVVMEAGEASTNQDGCYYKLTADHLKHGEASHGRRNIPDFDRRADTADTEDLSERTFLATEERIKGEQEELQRHREKALAAKGAGVDDRRVERCRDEVTSNTPYEQSQPFGPRHPQRRVIDDSEPRAEMDSSTLGRVNQAAATLADEFDDGRGPSRAELSQAIARRVQNGRSVLDAGLLVKEYYKRSEGIRQTLDEIDPYEQDETTVEVEVDRLWDPKSLSQRQVGLVTDESGKRVKFTVWQAAGDKPLIFEGDTIRVEQAKINIYKGDMTLAVAGDTTIHTVEEGRRDGGLPKRNEVVDGNHEEVWFSADADEHAWVSALGDDSEAGVTVECGSCEMQTTVDGWECDECGSAIIGATEPAEGGDSIEVNGVYFHDPQAAALAKLRPDKREQAWDGGDGEEMPSLGELDGTDTWVIHQECEGTRALPSEEEYQEMVEGSETILTFERTARCPTCEEEVSVNVEIKQLRAADESGTRVFHGECGCTWREDD